MEKQASQFAKSLARGARSKMAKAKRTYTCRTLKELIKAYRACTTSAEERALVKKESAHIRDLFKEGDTAFRRRNIAKLLFFHMNGYPTNFGMTECVKLCATEKFSDKRVAYLGLMILVDETEDILMLVTNSLKRDLSSPDQHIVGLALTVLSDLASADMARDLLPEIEKHLDSVNAYIRKKAALASVRAVRKLPDEETPNVLIAVPRLFETRQSASHISGTALVLALARQSSKNLTELRASSVPVMLTVLRNLLQTTNRTSAAKANIISGVRNPFLQVKVLQAVRTVARGASREAVEPICDVLAQVAANTDSTRIVGIAVLYECVRAIISLNTEPPLRTLAVSVLGRFLSHKDPNVRYIGLQELVKVVNSGKNDISIEEYRKTITECLSEADPSIRHRALELLHVIVTPQNATDIASELIEFMSSNPDDEDLRESAAEKLCSLTERFSPSPEWRCATFMRTLKEVDIVMPEPLVASFIAWVSAEPSAHAHAAKEAYSNGLLVTDSTSQHGATAGTLAPTSKALATVLDPFDSVQVAVPAAPVNANSSAQPSAKLEVVQQRKVRFERVCVYLFGEYGDYIIDTSRNGVGGISPDDAITAVDRVLGRSGAEVTSFSTTSLPCDPREDVFAHEVGLVREASMTALVKLAARLTYMASSDTNTGATGVSLGASVAAAALQQSNTGLLSLQGPQDLLALENGSADAGAAGVSSSAQSPPAQSSPKSNIGLGTDMLASLGIGETPPSLPPAIPGNGALVTSAGTGGGELSKFGGGELSKFGGGDSGDSLMLSGDDVGVHPILVRARRILAVHRQSMDLEAQQRACELSVLLKSDMSSLRALAFSRMPPMDYEVIRERLARSSSTAFAASSLPGTQAPFSEDLLSLLDDNVAGSTAATRETPVIGGPKGLLTLPSTDTASTGFGAETLDELLGGGSPGRGANNSSMGDAAKLAGQSVPVAPPGMMLDTNPTAFSGSAAVSAPNPPASTSDEAASAGSAVLCESDLLRVSSTFYKPNPEDPGVTRAELKFANKSASPFSKFVFQLAVPKYMRTDMQPASSSTVPATETTSQVVILTNTLHGSKPVQLRYRIQYQVDGEPVQQQGAVAAADLPAGL